MGAVLMFRESKESFSGIKIFLGKILTKIHNVANVGQPQSDPASILRTQNNRIRKLIIELNNIDDDINDNQ